MSTSEILHHFTVALLVMSLLHKSTVDGNEELFSKLNDDADEALRFVRRESRLSPPIASGYNDIGLNFKLYHIVDVSDSHQTVTLKARVIYRWQDGRIAWGRRGPLANSSTTKYLRLFGNVLDKKDGNDESKGFWRPEVKITQSLGMPNRFSPMLTQIDRNGQVLEVHYLIVHITCAMSTANFPLDYQRCPLTFYCHSCYQFYGPKDEVNGTFPNFNRVTEIIAARDRYFEDKGGQKNNIFELLSVNYTLKEHSPLITITMRRRSKYYFFYLLGPGVLLMVVSFLQFWIPTDISVIKIGLGVNCLLAMNVLFVVVKNNLSPDVEGLLPVLGTYFGVEMLLITAITIAATVVVYLHSKGRAVGRRSPSQAMLSACLVVAHVIFMRDSVRFLRNAIQRNKQASVRKKMSRQWTKANPEIRCTPLRRDFLDKSECVPNCHVTQETSLTRRCDIAQGNDVTAHERPRSRPEDEDNLLQHTDKHAEEKNEADIAAEWKVVANIVNNTFFVLTFIAAVVSMITMLGIPTLEYYMDR